MKKLKFLVPAIAASALTIAPMFSMTSCSKDEIDKTLAGYTVDKDTHRLYGLNKDNERFELEDKQIEDLKGGFLLTLGDESFLHIGKDGKTSDGTYYGKTIAEFFDRSADKHAFYYEIWLLGGDYELTDSTKDAHIKFDIKGVVDNHGKLTSTVVVAKESTTPKKPISIDVGDFRDLSFSTVNIEGVKKAEWNVAAWDISGADNMSFEYCHFNGLSIFTTEYLDLYGCTLDSDCIEWEAPYGTRTFSTTQYSLWVKDVNFASFSYCNFISDGKALKLQPTGVDSDNNPIDPTYVFNSCDFTIGKNGIPQEIVEGQTETESDQDKYAVDVCNTAVATGHYLYAYWYNITGNILNPKDPDYKRDWKNHAGKIGEMETTQWIEGKAKVIEGELPG